MANGGPNRTQRGVSFAVFALPLSDVFFAARLAPEAGTLEPPPALPPPPDSSAPLLATLPPPLLGPIIPTAAATWEPPRITSGSVVCRFGGGGGGLGRCGCDSCSCDGCGAGASGCGDCEMLTSRPSSESPSSADGNTFCHRYFGLCCVFYDLTRGRLRMPGPCGGAGDQDQSGSM